MIITDHDIVFNKISVCQSFDLTLLFIFSSDLSLVFPVDEKIGIGGGVDLLMVHL